MSSDKTPQARNGQSPMAASSVDSSPRQQSESLLTYRSMMDVSNSWALKKRVKPPGGGVLELFTKADDKNSYMYVLKTPSGSTVTLCRYMDDCTIYSYDASCERTRYITNSS